jgi:FeS assembly SUF system protein
MIESILKFVENKETMDTETRLKLEEKVVELLKTVFDPEIPVDVYNLGLVYKIEIDDDANLAIDMTMTAPSCPMADFIVEDARLKLETIEGLKSVNINVVFEPEWDKDMMSEEAKLELGML